MADNKNKRGPKDRKRVSLKERWEIRYWCNYFGCSKEDLEEAVSKVGHMTTDIEGYFG